MQFHNETGEGRLGRLIAVKKDKKPPEAKYFCLYFKELADAQRVFEIHESENKTISITLISDKADTVIRLVQHPATNKDVPADSRCIIYDVRGDQSQTFKAANFNDLYRKKPEYMKNEWLPLMGKLGIQIETPGSQTE